MQHHQRFHSLDGLRGIAAIAVVMVHAEESFMPGGKLAVDFFFCLSGFVIALSYGAKLRDGLSAIQFFKLRLARLYPMMFVGALMGVAQYQGSPGILLLIPDMSTSDLYPANPPFWSLYYELLVNIVFAIWLFRLSTRSLIAIMIGSGIVLGVAAVMLPWPPDFGPG